MRNRAWRRYTKDKIFKDRLLRVIKRYGSETIRSTLDSRYYYKLKNIVRSFLIVVGVGVNIKKELY